ncbi:MAG: hypothetical protein PHG82_02790 [Candidatus Gracilibacteria bacterium]|nr:hypothetical protein [Candidatus Gracilibacteria bacterium]
MNTNSVNKIADELKDYPIVDSIMDYNTFLEFLKTNIENPDLIIPDIDIIKDEKSEGEKSNSSYLINIPKNTGGRFIEFSNAIRNNIELILDSKNKASLNIKKIDLSNLPNIDLDRNKREIYLWVHYILANNKITHGIEDIKRISGRFNNFLINNEEKNELLIEVANATKGTLVPSILDISVAFPFQVLKSIQNISNIKYFKEIEKANKKENLLAKIIGNYKNSVQEISSELKKNIEKHILILEKIEKKIENNDFKTDEEKNKINLHIVKIKTSIENGENNLELFKNKIASIDNLYFTKGFAFFSQEIIKIENIKNKKNTHESGTKGTSEIFKTLEELLNEVKKIDKEILEKMEKEDLEKKGLKFDNFVQKGQVILSFEKALLNLGTDIFGEKKKIDPKYNKIINFDISKLIAQSNSGISIKTDENTGLIEYIADIEGKIKFSIENGKIKMTIVNPAELEIVEENLIADTDVSAKEARRNIQTTGNIKIGTLRTGANIGGSNIKIDDSEKRTRIEGQNVSSEGLIKSDINASGDIEVRNFNGNLMTGQNIKLWSRRGVNSYSNTFKCNNLQAISGDEEIVKSSLTEEGHGDYCTITGNKIEIGVLNGEQQNFILLQSKLIEYINNVFKIKWSETNPENNLVIDDANGIDNKLQKWHFKKPTRVIAGIIKKLELLKRVFENYSANLKVLETRRTEFYKKMNSFFSKTHKSEKLEEIFGDIEKHFISDMSRERDDIDSYANLLSGFLDNENERILDFSEIKIKLDEYVKSNKRIGVSNYLNYLSSLSSSDLGKELNSYFNFIPHETIIDASSGTGKYEIKENKLFESVVNYLINQYVNEIYKELRNIKIQPGYTDEFKKFINLLVPISLSDKYLSDKQNELQIREKLLNSIIFLSGDQELSIKYNFSNKSLVQIDNVVFNENILRGNAAGYIIESRKKNIFKSIGTRNIPILKGKGVSIRVEGGYIHYDAEIIFEREIIRMINSLDDNIFIPFSNKKPKLDEKINKLVGDKIGELKEKLLMLTMDSLTTPNSWEELNKNGINTNLISNIEKDRKTFEEEIINKIGGMRKIMHGVGKAFKK